MIPERIHPAFAPPIIGATPEPGPGASHPEGGWPLVPRSRSSRERRCPGDKGPPILPDLTMLFITYKITVMNKTPKRPQRRFALIIPKDECDVLYPQFCNSTHRTFGRYLRSILMQRPVTLFYRNKSIDEALLVMNQLKNKMESVERIFKTMAEHLNDNPLQASVVHGNGQLNSAWGMHRTVMEEIRLELIKIYESWLHMSDGQNN